MTKIEVLSQEETYQAVRKHALANCNTNGWDIFVECWGQEEFNQFAESLPTADVKEIIEELGKSLQAVADHRQDIQAETF